MTIIMQQGSINSNSLIYFNPFSYYETRARVGRLVIEPVMDINK